MQKHFSTWLITWDSRRSCNVVCMAYGIHECRLRFHVSSGDIEGDTAYYIKETGQSCKNDIQEERDSQFYFIDDLEECFN